MTDREILELAAKAAGIELIELDECESVLPDGTRWNPLTDDGDALRLAVTLEMDITRFAEHAVEVTGRRPTHGTPGNYVTIRNWLDTDPYAATRRAIVRAAAEIGKATP